MDPDIYFQQIDLGTEDFSVPIEIEGGVQFLLSEIEIEPGVVKSNITTIPVDEFVQGFIDLFEFPLDETYYFMDHDTDTDNHTDDNSLSTVTSQNKVAIRIGLECAQGGAPCSPRIFNTLILASQIPMMKEIEDVRCIEDPDSITDPIFYYNEGYTPSTSKVMGFIEETGSRLADVFHFNSFVDIFVGSIQSSYLEDKEDLFSILSPINRLKIECHRYITIIEKYSIRYQRNFQLFFTIIHFIMG